MNRQALEFADVTVASNREHRNPLHTCKPELVEMVRRASSTRAGPADVNAFPTVIPKGLDDPMAVVKMTLEPSAKASSLVVRSPAPDVIVLSLLDPLTELVLRKL